MIPVRRLITTRVSPSRKQASRAVGEHDLEPRVEPLQPAQQIAGTIGILDVGGMDNNAEQQAGGIDRDMPLAAFDLLRRIPAARPLRIHASKTIG